MPKYLVADHVQKIYEVEADAADRALAKFYMTDTWDHRKEGIKLLREQPSGAYLLTGPPPGPMMAQSGGQEPLVVPDSPAEEPADEEIEREG